jgi:protease PrsW
VTSSREGRSRLAKFFGDLAQPVPEAIDDWARVYRLRVQAVVVAVVVTTCGTLLTAIGGIWALVGVLVGIVVITGGMARLRRRVPDVSDEAASQEPARRLRKQGNLDEPRRRAERRDRASRAVQFEGLPVRIKAWFTRSTDRRWDQQRSVLLPVLGVVGMGICGLAVFGFVIVEVGPVGVMVGSLTALLPVVLVVGAFLWADRWEPEPPRLLLVAFGWGAFVATLSSLLINSTAQVAGEAILGEGSSDLAAATVFAPLAEETIKGALLFGLLWWRRREFDGVIDGIVYAGLVAAGFAFTENILYFGRAFEAGGLASEQGGVLTDFVLRGVLSPFAHPLFTAMTGIGVGLAAASHNAAVRVLAPIGGYLCAVVLHGLWNGSASIGGGSSFLIVYGLVMVPLFIGMIVLVVWQRRREQRVVAAALPGFAAAGWIMPSEATLLASLAGRRGWRAAVRKRSGPEAARALAQYQALVTQLAFLQDRMQRGRVGPIGFQWQHELLVALVAARARAVAMPDAMVAAWRQPPPPGWQPPPASD